MLSLTVIVQKYLLLTGSLLATASTDILYLHRNGDMSLSFLSLVADISFQCWQSSIIKFRSVPFRSGNFQLFRLKYQYKIAPHQICLRH